jgi:hypothetical protein
MEVVPALLVVHHALRQAGGAGRGVEQEEIADSQAPLRERTALQFVRRGQLAAKSPAVTR